MKHINRLVTILLLYVLLSLKTSAQNPYIISKTENEIEHPTVEDRNSCVSIGNYFFALRQKHIKGPNFKVYIDKYDGTTFTKISTTTLLNEVETAGQQAQAVLNTYVANNKIYVFYSETEKGKAITKLVIADVDGKVVTQPKVIGETPYKKGIYSCSLNDDIAFSPDETKFVWGISIKYLMYPQESYFNVYDANTLEILKTAPVTSKAGDFYLLSNEFSVDNAGDVMCSQHISKFDAFTKWQVVAFEFFKFKGDKSELFAINDTLNIRSSLIIADQNQFIVSGLCNQYESKKTPQPKLGNYFFQFDATSSKIQHMSFNYFDDNFQKNMTYKSGSGGVTDKDPTQKSYIVKDLINRNDGYYFIATHGFSGTDNIGYYELERELILYKFSKEGKLLWSTILPKCTQNKLKNYHLSFIGNKLYFIYAEHPKNLEDINLNAENLRDLKIVGNKYHGTTFVETNLDCETGKIIERKEIPAENDYFIAPINKSITFNNGNSIAVKFINKKSFYYGSINLTK